MEDVFYYVNTNCYKFLERNNKVSLELFINSELLIKISTYKF